MPPLHFSKPGTTHVYVVRRADFPALVARKMDGGDDVFGKHSTLTRLYSWLPSWLHPPRSHSPASSSSGSSSSGSSSSQWWYENETTLPKYATEKQRLETFRDWSAATAATAKHFVRPSELARAGFFYTGRGDVVECFACGGTLRDWCDADRDPWTCHAVRFPRCSYVRENKFTRTEDDDRDESATQNAACGGRRVEQETRGGLPECVSGKCKDQ